MTEAIPSDRGSAWAEPAYVQQQIKLIEEALTRVLFGDYSVTVKTDGAEPVWGYLARHVNVVINSARNAIASADRERRRAEAMYQLARSLASARDGEEILRMAVDEVTRLLGLDVVGLRLVEGDDLVLRAATGA